jgi:hypothetical protein
VKFPLLTSYAYARKWSADRWDAVANDDRFELLLDSGAFSAFNSGQEIALPDYMQFVEKYGDRLCGYMLLDKLQDPAQTEKNLLTMRGAGLAPIPIHVFGDDEARMNDLFAASPWVALGGFRRPHRGSAPASYVKAKMTWASGRRVHWLGYTNHAMVRAFKPYSCDSSNYAYTAQYGYLLLYLGAGEWTAFYRDDWFGTRGTAMTKKLEDKQFRARVRSAVAALGIDPGRLDVPEEWKEHHEVCEATMRSYVRHILDVRVHVGTREFLATTGNPGHLDDLDRALAHAARCGWLDDSRLTARSTP